MTVKERLHQIVEALPEPEAKRALEELEALVPKSELSDASHAVVPTVDEEPSVDVPAFTAFLDNIAANAPEEDLKRIPPDLSENLDHYVYGTRKRRE